MTDRLFITEEAYTKALHEAVAERGADWTYPDRGDQLYRSQDGSCLYVTRDGDPACIHGLALSKVLDRDMMPTSRTIMDIADLILDMQAAHEVVFDFSGSYMERLTAIQRAQDGGKPWGEAIRFLEGGAE